MKRWLRWTVIAAATLSGIVIFAYLGIYVLSERVMRQIYPIPTVSVSIPTDTQSIAEGRRLATLHGCFAGCHGRQAEGVLFFDQPMIARLVAPDLSVSAHTYSDAELVVAIRNGLRPGGRSMFIMPSETFNGLSDEDLVRIIAFIRSLPTTAGLGSSVSLGPLGRIGVATGQFKPAARLIAETLPLTTAANEDANLGRYVAQTVCTQCHGTDLNGTSNPEYTSPNLQLVKAYSLEQFSQLLRSGVALGGRNLSMMGPWARKNLSELTDGEITALYHYLHSLPQAT